MTIGSQGLKAVAGLGLAAIIFAGLASCSAAVLPDGAREVPDLMVSSPSVSAIAPGAGTTFTLSLAVSNQGEAESAAATLRYYRSTDATITSSDTEVGKDTVVELAAAGSSSRSVELTAPASPGAYYYGACVDPVRDESDTTNNCSTSVPVTVPEPETEPETEPDPERHPDLVVSPPSVSDSGPAAGATFTLSATVRNDGEGAAAATTLSYYQSTDATITTSDTALATVAIAGLAAAGSSSKSVDLTAPASPGTYYYGACVDPVTDETDTANNCSASVPVTVPEPEQRAPSVEIGPADDNENNEWAPSGDTVVLRAPVGDTVEFTVRVLDDQGEEIAGATVSWSSSNTNVATVDSSGVMTAVGVGSVTLTARATLPASSTQSSVTGRSAAAASRASGQAVAQSEGSVAGSIDVEVVSRASRIEITPASVSFEEVGARATLTATIYDQDDNVMQPTYWAWSSADRAVATVEGLSLASGIQASVQAIGEGTTKVTLSANGSATGTASVTVATATVRAPQPDLVVGSPSVNESAPAAGAPFTLSATVENEGEGESEATTLRYYRSPNATITTSDAQEGTDDVGVLSASATSEESISLTAPSSPGVYYYGACVEAVTDESDTTNNCLASVRVTVPKPPTPGKPDLIVSPVRATPSVSGFLSGAYFRLWAVVENSGDGAAEATTLRYYRSTDETITSSDTSEGTDDVGVLSASATSEESISLTAPSPGTYYYGACVEAVTDESDTTNNCSTFVRIDVREPPTSGKPDLVIPAVLAGSRVAGFPAGGSFRLSAVVQNYGDGASEATTLRYYRSTDETITSSDTSEGTDAVPGLAISRSSGQFVELTAPSSPGTYYYGACVDAVPNESDTTNNCSSVWVRVSEPEQRAPSVKVGVEDDKEWAPVGDTVDLSARVLDDEGEEVAGTTVTWSSSNTAVATVDSSGVMTAVGEGTVTLTATATAPSSATQSSAKVSDAARSRESGGAVAKREGTVSGSIRMTCVPRAARIEITPDSVSLDEVGATARLTATVYDADDNEIQPTYWRWSSADREVATVAGLAGVPLGADVTAVGAGTTTVTLRANGSATGTATVAVTLPRGRVAVWPRSLTFDAFGQTRSLTVRVLDGNGDEDEDASFSYRVSSGSTPRTLYLEKLDDGLQITAQGTVRGSITITSPGVESATVPVTVFQEPAALVVAPDSVSLTVGDTATLSARVMDANGHDIQLAGSGQRGRVVYWTTDDEEVATVAGEEVDRPGNRGGTATVTAAAAGTATITGTTMTLDGTGFVYVFGEATVTVTEPPTQD